MRKMLNNNNNDNFHPNIHHHHHDDDDDDDDNDNDDINGDKERNLNQNRQQQEKMTTTITVVKYQPFVDLNYNADDEYDDYLNDLDGVYFLSENESDDNDNGKHFDYGGKKQKQQQQQQQTEEDAKNNNLVNIMSSNIVEKHQSFQNNNNKFGNNSDKNNSLVVIEPNNWKSSNPPSFQYPLDSIFNDLNRKSIISHTSKEQDEDNDSIIRALKSFVNNNDNIPELIPAPIVDDRSKIIPKRDTQIQRSKRKNLDQETPRPSKIVKKSVKFVKPIPIVNNKPDDSADSVLKDPRVVKNVSNNKTCLVMKSEDKLLVKSGDKLLVKNVDELVQDKLAKKRAIREVNLQKQSEEHLKEETSPVSGSGNGFKTGIHRTFGKSFSPTYYTPDKPVSVMNSSCFDDNSNNSTVSAATSHWNEDKEVFILTVISLDGHSAHQSSEEQLLTFIETVRKKYDPTFYWYNKSNDEMFEYDDFKHYKNVMTTMITLDTWAQMIESNSNNQPIGPNGFSPISEVTVARTPSTVEEKHFVNLFFKCWFSNTDIAEDLHQFENFIVIIKSKPSRFKLDTNFFYGFVESIDVVTNPKNNQSKTTESQSIRYSIKLSREVYEKKWLPEVGKEREFTLRPIHYLRPTIRLIETMTSMAQNRADLFRSIIKPNYEDCSYEELLKKSNVRFRFHEIERYNEIQRIAIRAANHILELPALTNKILLVQGPPGTGKTHTLVGIVKNIFANISSKNKEMPLRILVCAPSNGAIDEIGRRLIREKRFLQKYQDRSLKIVRIGQKCQIHPDLVSYDLEQLVNMNLKAYAAKETAQIWKRSNIRDDILRNADVILSTLSSSQQNAMDFFREKSSKNAIRCLIVDEASQCVEPELLMPLIYESITKVIMIGDPFQLPATVISKKAQQLNFGRSLFERFYQHFLLKRSKNFWGELHNNLDGSPIIRLEHQFRMHPEICSFPSIQFYNGALKTGPEIGQNPHMKLHPYFVFDIIDSQESAQINKYNRTMAFRNNPSKFNDAEVEFICKLFQQILNHIGHSLNSLEPPPASIGIITFYREQRQRLLQQFQIRYSKEILRYVEINTVDGFQGQEKDIIILSCVRAFNSGTQSIGFLRSQQRMNVSLTRAKSLLCICLHGKSFENVPRWQTLLVDAQRRKRLFHVTSKITEYEIKLLLI